MATKTKSKASEEKPATDEEREELGAAKTGPLSEIGNMKPIESPEEDAGPEEEFLEDPSQREPVANVDPLKDAVLTTTVDETYPQRRLQSIYTTGEDVKDSDKS